ncbi:MAG: elongation factor G [Lachnospiraceae bacterium]|nr:elongation factor G [Lachnospiraceae bacterium]
MDVYKTEQIRNVVLLGHGGSGKTTLAEALAFHTKAIGRMGKVADGTTVSDYDKEEIKRGFSIRASVVPIEWEGLKINILDAPGYFDFVGQAEEAMSVADAAVIVVNGKAGVEVGTKKAWDICERRKIPCIFFVTNMDDPNADYVKIVEDLKQLYGKKIAPFHLPFYENDKFTGFVNVVKMGARKFKPDGTYEEIEIPNGVKGDLEDVRNMILEAVAESDEELMEKYFNGEEFTQEEISKALRKSVIEHDIIPVQMGSGTLTYGCNMLLQSFQKYFPAPDKSAVFKKGVNKKTGEEVLADKDPAKPVSAYVFKTIMDPFVGKYSLVKVCTGTLNAGDVVYNVTKEVEEKLQKLYVMRGKELIEVKTLESGDIGAIGKLSATRTGDTLSTRECPIEFHPTTMSKPQEYMRYKAKVKGEEDKVAQALQKILIEDLTLKTVNDEENRQMLLYGIGMQHMEIAASMLQERYKVEIELSKPKFAYRETITKKVEMVQGKHKKQSGGHGQYGDVKMNFEPLEDQTKAYEFSEQIFGGAVPKNYFPAVEKGIQDSLVKGPLAAYPVVGIKATLVDGSYHPVDSNEMAFKTASMLAFREGFMQAKPVLLEPIESLKIVVPDKFTGDIMGDLNKRRGRIMGMNPIAGGKQEIEAEIPSSELYGYSTDLRSMTGGMGEYEHEFIRYEQAPSDVQQREVEKRASKIEAIET